MRKEAGRESSIIEAVSIRIVTVMNSNMISYASQLKEQLLREIHVLLKILPDKEIVGREVASLVIGFFFLMQKLLGKYL